MSNHNNSSSPRGAESSLTTMPDAYRTAPLLSYCELCGVEAVARCLRCGRPYCSLHAPAAGDRCADCERAHRRVADRVSIGCTAIAAMLGVPSVVWAAWVSTPWAIGAAGVAFLGGWCLVALGLRVARGRFLANDAGDYPLLAGADLSIAPVGPGDGAATRRVRSWVHRGRGELPSVPMYQRTYGVG